MKYLIFIFSLLAFTSCKKEFASPEIKKAYDSVMLVHDEIMPELSTMNKLKRQIKKSKAEDPSVMALITNLEKADDGMMDWMAGFKLDSKISKADQLKYLSSEQIKINKVSADMKNSIKGAQLYLNANND